MSFEFDPQTEQGSTYDLIPNGVYEACVTDASIAPTRNGAGGMLHLTWQITQQGPYQNRSVWQSILYVHTSAAATRIGRAKIKDICDACGITAAITDVDVFKFKPCLITVGVEDQQNTDYPPKNKITRVLPRTAKVGLPTGQSPKDFPFNDGVPF